MGGDDDKLIRIPGETLSIKVSPEEEAYRKKYLPDAKKLTDEKLVCTVCSVSLAQNIHKGKDVYVHRALQVLVCEACYNFYGDGCFSADEDGDDKYCRWCGQGGTLYLCSACNCAFCQKCTKQNLKASVLAELENDDWKCYICNPRPLFGCRTICWGAQQLNKIGKEKEEERIAKIKERLEQLEAKKKEQAIERKSRKVSSSEDEASTKKRRRNSDGDSSSPEVIPKRRKRESRVKSESKNLNGSMGRRRKDSSSDSDSEGNKKTTRHSRTSNTKGKIAQSSSEDESDRKNKRDKIKKKKKKNEDSDDSSDTGKKKPKRRSVKKKDSSDDDSSEDEKLKKKKRLSVKKRDDSTDSSSNEKKKKKPKKKKNYTSSEESSGETKKNKKISKKKTASSSDKSSDEDEPSKSRRKTKKKPDKEEKGKKETADSDNEQRKIKKADSEEVNTSSAEDILVKKRIKLAILWLSTIVKDISELGTLISLRATKFSKKKINTENLKSYEDVLNCVSKIKQLISGVHFNYDHIEKTLDSHLKPWKILTGLEDADNEKNVDGDNNMSIDGDVSKADNTSAVQHENKDTSQDINSTLEESKVESVTEKNEENLNNWSDDSDDQTETRALISKANETLDKSQIEDQLSETGEKNSEDTKIDDESLHEKESNLDDDVKESKGKSKTIKTDPVKPDSEPKVQTAKKTLSKDNKDAKVNSEKSSNFKKDAESNSENERSPNKSSPLKNNSNGEESGEKSEAEGEEVSKGEIESEGDKENKPLHSDLGMTDHVQDSSEEDSLLESFTSRLKDKWHSGNTAEDMNLKQSLEPDSSNQSDTVYAKSAKDKVLEIKKEGEKQIPKLIINKLKLEGNKEGHTSIKRNKEKAESKHKTKQNDESNCLSSSEKEEALERKEEKEEPVPKIILNKFKLGECEEEKKHETTYSSKLKEGKSNTKSNSQKKIEDKKKNEDKEKGLSIDSEEEDGKKTAEKVKRDKSTSKHKTKNDKSNCLSCSDEEEQKQNIKTKSNSSKSKDTMKTKEDQSKRSSEDNEKESDNRKSKRSITNKKTEDDELKGDSEEGSKVNNKEHKSKDKDASGKKSKKDSEEDSKVKNKDHKSKDKDVSEKKSKKDGEEDSKVNKKDHKSKDKDASGEKSKKVGEDDSKVNNKDHKSKDKDVSEKKSKKDSEEDSKVKNKDHKSKDKDASGEKSKKVGEDDSKVNNKDHKSKDKDVSEKRSKKDSEEDSKVKNKDHKSKDKDVSEKKSKKDSEENSKVNNKDHKSKDKDVSDKKSKKDGEEDSKVNNKDYTSKDKDASDKKSKKDSEEDSKVNNKDHKSKDKDASDKKSKKDSEEDSKVNIKEHKSKDKDASGGKSIKDIEESDDKKNNKTKLHKNNLESKASRKSKLKEDNSDGEESTRSKKSKKSKESEEDEKSEDGNRKSKKNEKSSVCLDVSDDEQIDTAVVENGAESDGEKSTGDNQENAEKSHVDEQEDVNNGLNYKDETEFSLELQASRTENTHDIEMVQVKEIEPGNEQKENDQDEEKDSDMKDKVDSDKEKTKFVGLDSSSEEEIKIKKKKESPKKRPVRIKKPPRNVLVLSSDDEDVGGLEEPTLIESSDEDIKEEKDEDFAVVVESSAESSGSEILPKNKRKLKGSSDSDASISEVENNKKKKRRRIKVANSSDESGGSGDDSLDLSQKNDGESPAKGGRKNIKKIKKKGDLEQTTIEAAEEERERRRRIEERQKLFNQVFEIKESVKLEKLVLDFDPETKKELISVNKDLVAKMKPHQAKGVKFMWDSCFESVKQIKKTKGSGCILAHCMGLGKTFQVISLIHTLLTHEDLTKVRTIMVVCPLSTVLNWVNEFGKWLEDVEGGEDIEVFHLTRYNKNPDRARELRRWQHNSGVLIMGYEMFRNLTNESAKKFKAKLKKDFLETLIDPGADLIVCDEGHMLKNEATALSKAMTRVRTLRRIVLTGTPMQNNLKEYHCMVQFVKPNLLGTSKEFLNRFVNPINNGQFVDSTDHDVKLMKRRAHVLHKMLEGLVQRFDYNVLTPFLPPKQEYVISVCLSELQEKLYSHYLENESQKAQGMKGGTRLFMDWQTLGRVWTHPRVLKISTDKANWLKEKRAMEDTDSEGSLKDFIDDDSDKSTTEDSTDESSSDDGSRKKKKSVHKSRSTRSTRQTSNVALLESSDEEKAGEGEEAVEEVASKDDAWWTSFVEPHHFEDMRQSGKLVLLFAILKECELIEDKVLVFSQSLFSLDLIEYFLDKIDCATQDGRLDENLENHQGTWSKGLDYFRLDGSTSSENRNIWCKAFNREDNPRARLFLISTRAGGLGINLTAANRVIIFDASWNPSHDIQSIFRIYRFGQKKPCYVYRFVAFGTMEEKVYERQVAKQSISNRVVDEQQVHRHFSMNDLTELYSFTPASQLAERPTPALPRDPLMAEILSKVKAWIEKYHEHDSLLENVVEEELNEEERKAAWEDYENDKKRGFMPPVGPQGPAMNPNAAWNQQIEIMRQQLKLRYANKSDDEINSILVYQVSILMRQQQQQQMQMAAQMQAANNMGFRPQMYGNNMMPGFNQRPQMQTTAYLRNIAPKPSQQANYSPDQVYRMQQQANLARLQMQQMAQQQKAQSQPAPAKKGLQSLLAAQLSGTNYPTANIGAAINARAAAELQQMKQKYQDSRQPKPGVTITELPDDDKPSGSSES